MKFVVGVLGVMLVAFVPGVAGSQPEVPENFELEFVDEFAVVPGAVCQVVTANNVSVHPGNVLFVEWGPANRAGVGSEFVEGVEAVAGGSSTVEFQSDSAEVVRVFVLVDQTVAFPVTSVSVSVSCGSVPTTTTTLPPTTPPTVPTTPPTVPTTPTTHPDTGGVEWSGVFLVVGAVLGLVGAGLRLQGRWG